MISSYVITGFLGVGKTTLLLNSVKEYFNDKKIAVVVNEFGDVGVDGEILKNVYSEVLEISEGCICCKLSIEFEKGVTEIVSKFKPDIIFIETSGTSEPFPIVMSLQNLGMSVEGVICVIDTKNFFSYKDHSTAKYQIGSSNILVLNKIDLVTDSHLNEVEKEVKKIKEKYNIKNVLTGEPIFSSYMILKAKFGKIPEEIFKMGKGIKEVLDIKIDEISSNHLTTDAFFQKVIDFPDNVGFDYLNNFIKNIPDTVYRIKGIVKIKDTPTPLIVNYSFGNLTFSEIPNYKGKSFLILIGSQIQNKMPADR